MPRYLSFLLRIHSDRKEMLKLEEISKILSLTLKTWFFHCFESRSKLASFSNFLSEFFYHRLLYLLPNY